VQFVAIRMSVEAVIDIVITYRNDFKERIMNIAKNMEIIFVTAAVLLGATAYASAAQQAAVALQPAVQVAAAQAPKQVVVIKAKRLTAVEKANLS
jgi:hypothetical protein